MEHGPVKRQRVPPGAFYWKMFRTFNDGYIEPPFHANFGGLNVDFGNNAYAKFNLTLVDEG